MREKRKTSRLEKGEWCMFCQHDNRESRYYRRLYVRRTMPGQNTDWLVAMPMLYLQVIFFLNGTSFHRCGASF